MRTIEFNKVKNIVCDLAVRANTILRPDVLALLKKACAHEPSKRAKRFLRNIIENARIAQKEQLAICQDTGVPMVFVEIDNNVIVSGKGISQAVQEGICLGYQRGSLRNSMVKDPLRMRKQKPQFGPALIHYEHNNSSRLKITVLPKGFGCENKSQLKMFLPTARVDEIKAFVINAVKSAGPDACPPYVVGVGIGGSADYASLLAKKALLKTLTSIEPRVSSIEHKLERDLLREINKLNIGPMGLGGRTTALAVKVVTHPTHIAGLPVAVNISCHALRSASILL